MVQLSFSCFTDKHLISSNNGGTYATFPLTSYNHLSYSAILGEVSFPHVQNTQLKTLNSIEDASELGTHQRRGKNV